MAKRTKLMCPCCGEFQIKVLTCKEVEIECRVCGASLLITKSEDGTCLVSARPQPLPDKKVS